MNSVTISQSTFARLSHPAVHANAWAVVDSFEPPTADDWRRAVRSVALRLFQQVSGYGGEEISEISGHGSFETRLILAHEMLSFDGKPTSPHRAA
jgi:hypothetical protein